MGCLVGRVTRVEILLRRVRSRLNLKISGREPVGVRGTYRVLGRAGGNVGGVIEDQAVPRCVRKGGICFFRSRLVG